MRRWTRTLQFINVGIIRPYKAFCLYSLLLISCQEIIGVAAARVPHTVQSEGPNQESMTYHIEPMSAAAKMRLRNMTAYQLLILEKINRADRHHLPRLPEIVFPDRWETDERVYSPFPWHDPWAARYPKAMIVDKPLQAFGAYEQGRLVRWGPVSTGRRSRPTPAGLFHLNWRSRGRHSTVNPDWFMPWYFNFDNSRGLSFHAYSLPGYPASHACVRLLTDDAAWLYDWGEPAIADTDQRTVLKKGTPVLILGSYDFTSPPPWRSIPLDSSRSPRRQDKNIGLDKPPHVTSRP